MADPIGKDAANQGEHYEAHAPRLARALSSLHGEVNHLFNRVLRGVSFHAPFGSQHQSWLDYGFPAPAVDVTEDDKAFRVAIELPGVAPSDLEISVTDDMLIVKGEKREEVEEKGKIVHVFERSYGAFQRVFHMPDGVEREKIDARLDKGVLVIALPKAADAVRKHTRIDIKVA